MPACAFGSPPREPPSTFGALALVLGAIGTYGLMSYNTQRRTQELALRMALGAQRGDVLLAVLREGAWLAALGVVLGLGAAVVLTQFLRGMLFEVSPVHPVTYGVVARVLGEAAHLLADGVRISATWGLNASSALNQSMNPDDAT